MNRAPQRKRLVISKQMARAIQKAEAEIEKEGDKQLDLQMCSAMLALSRYWNWKKEQLQELQKMQQDIWHEVGQNNDLSMIQLLDEECDIELTNHEGTSYREFKFLYTPIDDGHELSPQEWIIMRNKQKQWTECQVMACIFLGMSRKAHWSVRRIKELMDRMQDIKESYDYNPKKLSRAVMEECKIDWLGDRGKVNG